MSAQPPPVQAPAQASAQPSAQPVLALATRDLRKSFGRRVALDGLTLSVPQGVVYGFLGPNGAGKTTTMRLLTGLIRPGGGSIELLGVPFRGGGRSLHSVGAIVETPAFYPYLSGRANLQTLGATGAPTSRARIEELLQLVGLTERASDRVSRYSLGMKQRLGIAAALLSDPHLLLLDEPANGLDPAGIVGLRDTLRALAASGKTVFVSSHLLAEVQQLADIVGIIAAGRLVREGPMHELLGGGGVVHVQVDLAEVDRARGVLEEVAGPGAVQVHVTGAVARLTLRAPMTAASAINRRLAQAGIYASRLESGSDLESLFLELTGGQTAGGPMGPAGTGPTS